MIRLTAALLLMPGVALAQSYLPEPNLAAATARSQAECELMGCQGTTDLWWSLGSFYSPQNGNSAYLIIQPSGDYGPSPSNNAGTFPLSQEETASLLSVEQVSPSVSLQTPNQIATAGQLWSFTLPNGTFTDPRGEVMTYDISGSSAASLSWMTMVGTTISGTPPTAGTYSITVTATDQSGFSNSMTFTLTVQ